MAPTRTSLQRHRSARPAPLGGSADRPTCTLVRPAVASAPRHSSHPSRCTERAYGHEDAFWRRSQQLAVWLLAFGLTYLAVRIVAVLFVQVVQP